jgi:hypothetical protein
LILRKGSGLAFSLFYPYISAKKPGYESSIDYFDGHGITDVHVRSRMQEKK